MDHTLHFVVGAMRPKHYQTILTLDEKHENVSHCAFKLMSKLIPQKGQGIPFSIVAT